MCGAKITKIKYILCITYHCPLQNYYRLAELQTLCLSLKPQSGPPRTDSKSYTKSAIRIYLRQIRRYGDGDGDGGGGGGGQSSVVLSGL